MNDSNFISRTKDEHKEEYKFLLEKSIKLRFRSDVKVGFNISGGLDSSILLALVHNLFPDKEIESFTFYCDNNKYDEIQWVDKIICETNKIHNKILFRVDDVPSLIKKISYFQDEPYGGIPTLAYSNIFKDAKSKGIKVLLDGQGFDESWAGYDYYHNDVNSVIQGVVNNPFNKNILNDSFKKKILLNNKIEPYKSTLLNKQYRDLFYTKLPRALRFNDRISMMYSTELREPFLDHSLVEYAFSLPKKFKIRNGESKWLLRYIAKDYLKTDIIFSPKRPLQTPQREWLKNELFSLSEYYYNEILNIPWFNKNKIKSQWNLFNNSKIDNTFFLWQWYSAVESYKL